MKKWLGFLLWLLIVLLISLSLLWLMLRQNRDTSRDTVQKPQPTKPELPPSKPNKPQDKTKPQPPLTAPKVSDELRLVSGMVQPANDSRFTQLPKNYSNKSTYVQKPVAAALLKMMDAAQADGIELTVISGFRSYREQMAIWQRKWNAGEGLDDVTRVNQILKFSSMPGISRHHWGTDVDFNNLEPAYWRGEQGAKIQQWLSTHAPSFGFCEPYSGKTQGKRSGGYEDEAWHWSYRPIAAPLQNLRSANMNDVLQQPIVGQNVVSEIPERMRAYVTSVAANCQ